MKISRGNKNVTFFLLYLIVSACILTCNSQKDKISHWDVEGDFETAKNFDNGVASPERTLCFFGNFLEECEDERENFVYNMQLRKRQPGHNAAVTSAFAANKADKSIRAPMFQSQTTACSCEMQHHVLDLGSLYYPKYVPTMICKPGGCHGGRRCHPKKYNVHVLKQKQVEDIDRVEQTSADLPEMLKDGFLSETISVIVACECTP